MIPWRDIIWSPTKCQVGMLKRLKSIRIGKNCQIWHKLPNLAAHKKLVQGLFSLTGRAYLKVIILVYHALKPVKLGVTCKASLNTQCCSVWILFQHFGDKTLIRRLRNLATFISRRNISWKQILNQFRSIFCQIKIKPVKNRWHFSPEILQLFST